MVKERIDIPAPDGAQSRYEFDKVRPGASWHVDTNGERCRVLTAFSYWAKNIKKIPAKAMSKKVGAEDPDGPGYRIWFVSTRKSPPEKPAEPAGEI